MLFFFPDKILFLTHVSLPKPHLIDLTSPVRERQSEPTVTPWVTLLPHPLTGVYRRWRCSRRVAGLPPPPTVLVRPGSPWLGLAQRGAVPAAGGLA